MSAKFAVKVDDSVHVSEGGDQVGAVRRVTPDHLMVYIEGAGDFRVDGYEVHASHDGKLILDTNHLEPALRDAIKRAHKHETE